MSSVAAAIGATAHGQPNANALRTFQYHASESQLNEMKRRIKATRWPERETVADDSQGIPLATMQAFAQRWTGDYDWRKCEKRLNGYPQFMTVIDGLDIHFMHIRWKHANAMPLIVTHGWPGSVLEQLKIWVR